MTKKIFTLFFLLMSTAGLCKAQGSQLISPTYTADGVEYNTNISAPAASTLVFKTVNDAISGYWAISAETTNGNYTIIARSDENLPSQEFILDTDCVDWGSLKVRRHYRLHPKHMPDNDYADYGYGLNIEFISTQDELDNTFVTYNNVPRILPDKPQISGIHFLDEEFDPENDSFSGELTFEIDCENATNLWVEMYNKDNIPYFTVDDWRTEILSAPSGMFFEDEDVVNGHMTYTHRHSWGDVILVRGINEHGTGIYTSPIFTADYITDPAALERFEELHTSVGTDITFADGLKIVRTGHEVSAVSDSEAVVTLAVTGVDGAKRAVVTGRGQAVANLSSLAPGVYVVRASDGSNVKTIKIMIQGGNQ